MAKQPQKQYLAIDKREGQVTAHGGQLANYFLRNIPLWSQPAWQTAEMWRQFVLKQPIASICRDTIANYLNSLDWAIVARDTDQRDELKPRIKYYTKLLERGNAYYYDIDFSSHIEWLTKDLFDLPFGCASEIGRVDDNPKGRVVWIRPLDGGTLAPTLNFDFPIVQVAPNAGQINPIYLPKEFVSRVYLSPRTELRREGWGFAPPERIYLAIEMLYRGDNYYSQLLLNTPEAGILDLGDISKETAEEWVKSLRDLLYGVDPLKIPVLYEHTSQAKWIPFGRPPSEIMYDTITMKYASVLCSGYGLTLSDIGFPSSSNGGNSLAGVIRQERVTQNSGKAIAKKKFEAYWNRILPDSLRFMWIDYDDERNVSKGRARLASAQAAQIWVTEKMFLPNELRQQTLADGLVNIDLPETVDPNDPGFPQPTSPFGKIGGSKPQSLGNPVNPSQGGQGETLPQQILQKSSAKAEVGIAKSVFTANEILSVLLKTVKGNLSNEELAVWEQAVDEYLSHKSDIEEPLKASLDDIRTRIKTALVPQGWLIELANAVVDKVIEDKTAEEVSRQMFYEAQKAEERYIEGKSDSLDVQENMVNVDLSAKRNRLTPYILDNFASLVADYSLMVSKSVLLENLEVDATEAISNNIRVSRETAQEVVKNLSQLANSVYADGMKMIGENNG